MPSVGFLQWYMKPWLALIPCMCEWGLQDLISSRGPSGPGHQQSLRHWVSWPVTGFKQPAALVTFQWLLRKARQLLHLSLWESWASMQEGWILAVKTPWKGHLEREREALQPRPRWGQQKNLPLLSPSQHTESQSLLWEIMTMAVLSHLVLGWLVMQRVMENSVFCIFRSLIGYLCNCRW